MVFFRFLKKNYRTWPKKKKTAAVFGETVHSRELQTTAQNASFTSTSDSKIKVSSLKLKGLTGLGRPRIKPIESWPSIPKRVGGWTNQPHLKKYVFKSSWIFSQIINRDQKIPPSQDFGLEKGESF